jgi:hypothetical protein
MCEDAKCEWDRGRGRQLECKISRWYTDCQYAGEQNKNEGLAPRPWLNCFAMNRRTDATIAVKKIAETSMLP